MYFIDEQNKQQIATPMKNMSSTHIAHSTDSERWTMIEQRSVYVW